jgi:hypothetical protein
VQPILRHPSHRDQIFICLALPRGLARAWTRAVTRTNKEMAGQPSWEPLPTRMEQLLRGITPKAAAAPMTPDAEKATALLDAVTDRGRALAELRRDGEQDSTAELQARVAVRQAVRDAWAEGIEHTVQLSVLAEAGLADDAALAAAGWEPVLLAAIDLSQGWGRPSKAGAVRARPGRYTDRPLGVEELPTQCGARGDGRRRASADGPAVAAHRHAGTADGLTAVIAVTVSVTATIRRSTGGGGGLAARVLAGLPGLVSREHTAGADVGEHGQFCGGVHDGNGG